MLLPADIISTYDHPLGEFRCCGPFAGGLVQPFSLVWAMFWVLFLLSWRGLL